MRRYLGIGVLSAALLTTVWGLGLVRPAHSAAPVPATKEEPFHDLLLKAAREYTDFGRVDDEMRWAPYLCRMPMPGTAHVSASKDSDTHGRKLYSLFAKDRDAYFLLARDRTAPVGQVIVKQSWVPEEVPGGKVGIPRQEVVVTPPRDRKRTAWEGDHFWPYATGKDGKRYKATKQSGLFIMLKLDPKTPGTDNGWVYGTVTPDGKKVTAAGRVESCMKCHQQTKTDRLFGLR
ncbi:MAG TPA: cytochrome P460 family protein [Gemmataceae bacterium]|nr:cytochrome P460 family protein [Gemmataceae bacterium]